MTQVSRVTTISCKELGALVAAGKACEVIDVRTPAEYAGVHAACARLVPLETLSAKTVLSGRSGAAGEPIYVLCKSGGRARKAREKFVAAGFEGAVVVEGGTDAWVAAGLPVTCGTSKVISLERQVRIAAGLLVVTGVVLGLTVHPWLIGISGFVGLGLVFAGVTDFCGMGMLLAKMPWNQKGKCDTACCVKK